MQNFSPTEEQCERIRLGVMQKLSENPDKPDTYSKKKKPLYLKIAAISGTAVCAAALLIVVFTGLRGSRFLESANNAAGGHFAQEDHNGGAANAPGFDYEDNGGNLGVIGSMTNSREPSSLPGIAASGEGAYPSDHAAPGYTSSPSGGRDPQLPDDPETSESSSDIPYLLFSEDNEICEVTMHGEIIPYKSSDIYISNEDSGELISAGSNLGSDFFVRFDDNVMVVFGSDGTVFGVYIR